MITNLKNPVTENYKDLKNIILTEHIKVKLLLIQKIKILIFLVTSSTTKTMEYKYAISIPNSVHFVL
jgi:hypothetical protein